MNVEFIPFKPEHAAELTVVANHGEAQRPNWGDADAMLRQRAEYPSITIMADGKVAAIIGVVPVHRHRGAIWAAISADIVESNPAAVARYGRKVIDEFESRGFTRLEAEIPTHWIVNARYAQFLGFEVEGLMRGAWVDGSDAFLMARVA